MSSWSPGKDPVILEPVLGFWNPIHGYPKNPQKGDRYLCEIGAYDSYHGRWNHDFIYEWDGKVWKGHVSKYGEIVFIKSNQALYRYVAESSYECSWNFFLSFKNPEVLVYAFKVGILENKELLRNMADIVEKGFGNEKV